MRMIRLAERDKILANRLEDYHTLTEPIIEYYQNQGKLSTVDGTLSVDDIYGKIERTLSAK